jgi:CMP-N,N'-diacetyllegionaminic acid synthase
MFKKKIIAIILARAGSKGIKNKNLLRINGKPLIYWSIKSFLNSNKIQSVWVSSNSKKILSISQKYGANIVKRPENISHDFSPSESAWIHALRYIKNKVNENEIDAVVGVQPTSPIRTTELINEAINKFYKKKLDSLFTSKKINDHFIWKRIGSSLKANYNYRKRQMRQKISDKYLENGSFYIFKAEKFLKKKCRLFGKIGTFVMPKIYSFQIDDKEDIKIIKSLKKNLR